MQHCFPGAPLWIYSSSGAYTAWRRCWSFQFSEEWCHGALDTKPPQLPLGNALSLKKILSCFKACADEAGGNQDIPERDNPHCCMLGQGITSPVLYYINFNCLFVLIPLPLGSSTQGCGETENYINQLFPMGLMQIFVNQQFPRQTTTYLLPS